MSLGGEMKVPAGRIRESGFRIQESGVRSQEPKEHLPLAPSAFCGLPAAFAEDVTEKALCRHGSPRQGVTADRGKENR
jgi:hypothetical protein